MFRLIVSDVDGTLIDGRQRLPSANLVAVRRLAESGVAFTLATGRIEESVKPFLARVPVTAPLILYNGAKVVEEATLAPLYEALVPPEAVAASLRAAEGLPLTPLLYREGRCYIGHVNPVNLSYAAKDRVTLHPAGNLLMLADQPASKLLFIAGANAEADEVFGEFAGRLGPAVDGRAQLVRSEPAYLEVLPYGTSKGTALLWLLDRMGLSPEEVIALGDNLNDLELLAVAGLGVAVADAHPRVREAADYVSVGCGEGAIADVAARFLELSPD